MALNNKKQSTLEKKGITERGNEISLSHYNKNKAYSESHEDALSDPTNDKKYLGKAFVPPSGVGLRLLGEGAKCVPPEGV